MVKKIQKATNNIITFFDNYPQKILTPSQLKEIFHKNSESLQLPKTMSNQDLIEYLCNSLYLKRIKFNFKNRIIIRYIWRERPFYEILMSFTPNCYLSHYSAVYLHQLTDQIPKAFYLNSEQSNKPSFKTELKQDKIDWAFQRPTRLSKNMVIYEGRTIYLLNGQFTNNLGVVEPKTPEGEFIRISNIERTLIDITVRPEYSGGVFEVLRAYKYAKDRVSINHLVAMLRKINYIYPYHQAIGFYMEKSGSYALSQINMLREFEIKLNFYITHQLKDPKYSKEWKLFYPKGFD